ncbi:MAG: GAF domain-containing sensor histidine kinase [Polyangiaceae bacterium]|nr:GAF domain-containing sensor histidine kinase [Polyangiaceae bacterium]
MTAKPDPLVHYLGSDAVPTFDPTLTEQRALDAVNARIAARRSTEEILDFLFDHTSPLCPGDRLSVAFAEDAGQRLVSYHTVARYAPLALDRGFAGDLRGSSLERVLMTGVVRIIDDLARYLVEHPASRATRMLVAEGVRSSLTCPLRVESRVVGVLFRSAREPHAFTPRHAAFHLALAERLAQAIEKTYRLEQLRAANLAYSEMLAFVTHELKSPVAAMVSTAQLLRDGYLGPTNDAQRDAATRMVTRGEYLLGLVRDYLELARLEGGGVSYAPRDDVDLDHDVLDIALDIVRPEAARRGVRIERQVPADLGPVQVDPALLRVILVNLLGNAVKYGREDGMARVTARRDEQELRLTVWNEGPGFPAAEQSRLFRKFSRLPSPELQQEPGSGVGLYTVWRLATLHGGRVVARSEHGAWAEFECTIPQPPPPAVPARNTDI